MNSKKRVRFGIRYSALRHITMADESYRYLAGTTYVSTRSLLRESIDIVFINNIINIIAKTLKTPI